MSHPSRNIRLVQCLCPHRHCIMALAFDPRAMADSEATDRLKESIAELIAEKSINPWCELCRSREWHYEVGVTGFATLEQARPILQEEQARQLATQAYFRDLPRRYDS